MRILAPSGFVMGAGMALLPASTGEMSSGVATAWVTGLLTLAIGAGFAIEHIVLPVIRQRQMRGTQSSSVVRIRLSAIAGTALACFFFGSVHLWAAGIIWASRPEVERTLRSLPMEIENNRLGHLSTVSSEAFRLIQGRKVTGTLSPFNGCGWGPVTTIDDAEGKVWAEFMTRTRVGTGTSTLIRQGCIQRYQARISFSAIVLFSLLGRDKVNISVLDYSTVKIVIPS